MPRFSHALTGLPLKYRMLTYLTSARRLGAATNIWKNFVKETGIKLEE